MTTFHTQDKLRRSPKPAARKLSPSPAGLAEEKDGGFKPKQFHGAKPDPAKKDGLLTTPMIVPAIGIFLLRSSFFWLHMSLSFISMSTSAFVRHIQLISYS